jgi:pre-mRNA-splicing factor ATP-dependent RNA helicase DHX16
MQADNEPKLTEPEKKKLSLQETRRSLPIFPFRDDLIQAIKDHQVSLWDVVAFLVSILICAS